MLNNRHVHIISFCKSHGCFGRIYTFNIPIKNWDWKIVVAIGITVCSIAIFVVRAIEYDMDVKNLVYVMAIADFIKANSDEEVLAILQNIIGSGGHNETGCE